MDTAKLFTTGRSQAVRLPKAYRFDGQEVIIKRVGTGVLLLSPSKEAQQAFWQRWYDDLPAVDTPLEREQTEEQQRDWTL